MNWTLFIYSQLSFTCLFFSEQNNKNFSNEPRGCSKKCVYIKKMSKMKKVGFGFLIWITLWTLDFHNKIVYISVWLSIESILFQFWSFEMLLRLRFNKYDFCHLDSWRWNMICVPKTKNFVMSLKLMHSINIHMLYVICILYTLIVFASENKLHACIDFFDHLFDIYKHCTI